MGACVAVRLVFTRYLVWFPNVRPAIIPPTLSSVRSGATKVYYYLVLYTTYLTLCLRNLGIEL